jgi:isoaspartyl peptidase/L-asparaginase-like protein (Ntn-hydrolase superfamily)
VCAVKGYEHVISLARQVMRATSARLPGERGRRAPGARAWLPRRRLLTARARSTFDRGDAALAGYRSLQDARAATQDPQVAATAEDYFGTVNVIAIDRRVTSPAASAPAAGPGSIPGASETRP